MHDDLRRQELEMLDCLMEFDRAYEAYARSAGLTYFSLSVLEMIYRNDGACTQKSVSEGLMCPKQSVNLIVREWLDDGYLALVPLDSDRRNKRICLTDKGRDYAGRIIGRLERADESAFSRLTVDDREAFVRFAKIYTSAFSEEIAKLC